MSKLSIIFQIIKKSIFEPKLVLELAEEKSEMKDDEKYKSHKYEYDFENINEFFKREFPDVDIKEFDVELDELDLHVKDFFNKLDKKKYPSKEKPYPIDYSINSDSRRFLYILCRIIKPKNIVETGVAYGLSSFYILKALNKNNLGTLFSIDSIFRPWQTEKMIGSIIPENLRSRWNLILGKSNKKLKIIFNEIDNVEIFIHDSLHSYKNMMFEFDCALNQLKKNGIIISDDILGNDAFYQFAKNKKIKKTIVRVKGDGLGIIQKD